MAASLDSAQLEKQIERARDYKAERLAETAAALERAKNAHAEWERMTPIQVLSLISQEERDDQSRAESKAERERNQASNLEDERRRIRKDGATRVFNWVFAGSFPLALLLGYLGGGPNAMLAPTYYCVIAMYAMVTVNAG